MWGGLLFLVIRREEYSECPHLKSGYSGINLFSAVPLHTLECISELERMDAEELPSIYTFLLRPGLQVLLRWNRSL